MKKIIFLILLLLQLLPLSAKDTKDILVVCSFPLSGTWAKNTLDPITELDTDKSKLNIHYSIMRNSSFKTVEEYETQENTIFDFYEETRPDFILIFGPGNYILAEDFNNKWDGVPMLLVGELNYVCHKEYVCDSVSKADATRIPMREFAKDKNMTFLYTPVYIEALTDLICLVNPSVREFFFIGGEEYLSREIETEMRWATKAFGKKFTPIHPDDFTFRDVSIMLSNADKKTSAFVYCNWHNKQGIEDTTLPAEGMRSRLELLLPLFNTYYTKMGNEDNTTGFVSYDHEQYKKEIKRMFLSIVQDLKAPREIPFVTLNKDKPVLNYRKLVTMGFHTDILPKGVNIVNLPPTFWQKYRVSLLSFIILLLTAISILFFVLYKKQKRLRMELKEAKEKAEESEKMKTAFIHTVSHEIRTPLNAVIGFSQLLSLPDYDISNEEKALYSTYINNNSEMLLMLVNDILNIANIEKDQFTILKGKVLCNEVCNKAISIAESRLPGNVKMYYTTEVSDDFSIESDGKRIQQVLINYLTNSCKHTEEGEIRLHCSLKEHAGKVTFSVTDTGTGVPVEMAEKIFERFTKLNNYKQGVGLGLNICRTIAEKLDGEVKLDTSYTDGARFVFILPV